MAVVIGCGGSGSDGSKSSTDGSTSTSASTAVSVNLGAKPGQIELTFLTGQGRVGTRATGDIVATVTIPQFTDNTGRTIDLSSDSPPLVQLNAYQNQIFRINADILKYQDPLTGRSINSRVFETYPLDIAKLRAQTDSGTQIVTTVVGLPISFPTKVRIFPGRYTSVPVYLNDAQFTLTPSDTGSYTANFNVDQFKVDNSLDTFSTLPAFLSDYLAFDISELADAKPILNGGPGGSAGRFYLSGDGFSLSQGGSSGYYEALTRTPGQFISGRFAPPGTIGVGLPPGVTSATTPGTYSLFQPDPSNPDPSSNVRITSLQGIWRDYTRMLLNLGSTTDLGVSFPSSDDGDVQDVILINQTSTGGTYKVKHAVYGIVDLGALTARVYPLANVSTASIANEKKGTITQLLDINGTPTNSPQQARKGVIHFDSAPTGIAKDVTFYVYRH
jgi:hypothetical protein